MGKKLHCLVVLGKMDFHLLLLFDLSCLAPCVSVRTSPAQLVVIPADVRDTATLNVTRLSLLHLHQALCVSVICFPLLTWLSQFLFHPC